MARKGVRKLEVLKHDVSGIEVAIYLNTHNSTFEATVEQDGEDIRDKDLNELKKRLKKYLDGRVDLGWRWIIEINLEKEDHYRGQPKKHTFGFAMKKYPISSHRVNGKYLCTEPREFTKQHVDYGNEEAFYLKDSNVWRYFQTEEEGEVVFPNTRDAGYHGNMVFLEYTVEVWAALQKMQETISLVATQFHELIGTDEGYDRMGEIGREILKMLPAPAEEL